VAGPVGEAGAAVILLDLNGFKLINDTWGHESGDAMLIGVADLLRRATPPGATIGRLGGDEFAVLLARAGQDDAETTARRITDEAARPILLDGARHRACASISIGVATSTGAADSAHLLHAADLAMYSAKAAGGGWRSASTDGH
jgi:diguanylate cyclase (GGDEF)-like protein